MAGKRRKKQRLTNANKEGPLFKQRVNIIGSLVAARTGDTTEVLVGGGGVLATEWGGGAEGAAMDTVRATEFERRSGRWRRTGRRDGAVGVIDE